MSPACQRCLYIIDPHKLIIPLSLLRATYSILFEAYMLFMSTNLGSLHKNESNDTSFIDMLDVAIFSSV